MTVIGETMRISAAELTKPRDHLPPHSYKAEPMSKEDTIRRRAEGAMQHELQCHPHDTWAVERKWRAIMEYIEYIAEPRDNCRPSATDHQGRPMTYWGGLEGL